MAEAKTGLREFTQAIEHSPVPAVYCYANASQTLMNLGRFDDAKQLIDQYVKKGIPCFLIKWIYALSHRLYRKRYGNDGTARPGNSC